MSISAEKAASRIDTEAIRLPEDPGVDGVDLIYSKHKATAIIDEEMKPERAEMRQVSHTKSDTILRLRGVITRREERIRVLLGATEKLLAGGAAASELLEAHERIVLEIPEFYKALKEDGVEPAPWMSDWLTLVESISQVAITKATRGVR